MPTKTYLEQQKKNRIIAVKVIKVLKVPFFFLLSLFLSHGNNMRYCFRVHHPLQQKCIEYVEKKRY